MEYKLNQGNQSNYEISLTVVADDLAAHKQKALESFQKEMKEPGFRPGHVPMDIVEKKVRPEYLEVAIYEEVIHAGTKKILAENNEIKFIGNIYDLNKEEKDGQTTFTFKLDIYPEITEKDDGWKKLTIEKIDSTASKEEIDETLDNLRKQYASYEEATTVSATTVFKITFAHKDADGNEIDTGSAFLGKEEIEEFPTLVDIFVGKTKEGNFDVPYSSEFPPMLQNRNSEKEAATTTFTIGDIREVTLPDFSPENIKKFFGNDEVTTKEQLEEKISGLIAQQKEEALLMQSIDKLLTEASQSLTIIIPKTLVEEELKTRMKSLEERMGGPEGLQKYFEQVGDEEKAKMMTDIKSAAGSSLEKFFVLRRLTELLELVDIDWQKPMDVERQLYAKLAK